MLILECSQGYYGRTDGRMDGSVTISLRNFVDEGIISLISVIGINCQKYKLDTQKKTKTTE